MFNDLYLVTKLRVNYSLSLGLLNTEHKPSVKNTGQPASILKFTGQVEKILTGSTSELHIIHVSAICFAKQSVYI